MQKRNPMPLSPALSANLEQSFGPIVAQFEISRTPAGGAPEAIRQDWIGVRLPVREQNIGRHILRAEQSFDFLTQELGTSDHPVAVCGMEAIDALFKAKRERAFQFWIPFGLGTFVFNGHEGDLKPVDTIS
jgi:hypothetical protein